MTANSCGSSPQLPKPGRGQAPLPARTSQALRRLARFASDARGNFAIMFALMAPVLIVILGMGLDYVDALSHKARWDSACDAAVLKANQVAEAYATANSGSQAYATLMQNAVTAGIAAGSAAFKANAGASLTTATVTPTVTMTYSGTTFTATATYTASLAAYFGGLVGTNTLAISGHSTATGALTTYVNYYILVDISQSMGIGATQTDMANLYNITSAIGYSDNGEPGCVFGCHVVEFGRAYSNEQVAHLNNITLRIDAAKTAIQDVINSASQNSTSGNIQIGLYTMQYNYNTSSYRAVQVAAPTNNYTSLTTALSTIDLGPNNSGGIGDSDMTATIEDFAGNILPSSGAGLTASTPVNYVFVVTDGLIDQTSTACPPDDHCTSVLSSSTCSTLQQKATVGVIYTTYLPLYKANNSANGYDPLYSDLVLPVASNIAPALQACASSSQYYFQADDGPALISAMNNLFASTLGSLRLTQ